ncbi:MAG: zinc ribbon domain-containing protein [Proteobacteria bacterium]|nr:zinc ribbon domain-containing protein [Burkholderiales bacterium]
MPIYAYRCASCGFEQDVLQKLSEDPLTDCPTCNAATFTKQVTAAGFQLKGSGWYVTDFRDSGKKKPLDKKAGDSAGAGEQKSGDAAGAGDAKPAGSDTPVAATTEKSDHKADSRSDQKGAGKNDGPALAAKSAPTPAPSSPSPASSTGGKPAAQ